MFLTFQATNISLDLNSEVSGTLPVDNGGTGNSNLSLTSGSVCYVDGEKITSLTPGDPGSFLSVTSSGLEWSNPLQSGTYTPTLTATVGSITSQRYVRQEYVYIPDQKLCFLDFNVVFSGTGFTGATVLKVDLPFPAHSQSGDDVFTFLPGHEYLPGIGRYKAFPHIWHGDPDVITFGNPTSLADATGGHGTAPSAAILEAKGWYRTA